MTDWAAEAVTRGDLYGWAIVLMIHMWAIARYIAFAIEGARDTETKWTLSGISTILAQIRDNMPKPKAPNTHDGLDTRSVRCIDEGPAPSA